MSSTNSYEKPTICSKSNKKVMNGNDTNKIIQKLFDSLLHKYQTCLKRSTKGSNFIFLSCFRNVYRVPKDNHKLW